MLWKGADDVPLGWKDNTLGAMPQSVFELQVVSMTKLIEVCYIHDGYDVGRLAIQPAGELLIVRYQVRNVNFAGILLDQYVFSDLVARTCLVHIRSTRMSSLTGI